MEEEGQLQVELPLVDISDETTWDWQYIPDLIKEQILNHLDVKRLLLYRTISSSWNDIICEKVLYDKVAIHLRAHFTYSKHAKSLSKKMNIFVNKHSKKTKFRSLAIHAEGEATSKLKAKKIQAFLNDNGKDKKWIEKISIDSYHKSSGVFNLFLNTGALTDNPYLTHMKLHLIQHLPTISLNDQPINLPALTHLSVYNKIDLETPDGYTVQVINSAPNLTNLCLEWYGTNMNMVPSLKLQNLKVLKLSGFSFATNQVDFPQILQKISETIQELYTEDYFVKLGSAGIPMLPRLHTLHVALRWRIEPNFNFTHFQTWLRHDNLPKLRNIGLMQVNQFVDNSGLVPLVPHNGVKTLCIEPNGYHIRNILNSSLTWFGHFRNKFPAINHVDFTWINYGFLDDDAYDKILANLIRVFPTLTTLTLRIAQLKQIYFTGVERQLMELYRRENWLDMDMIPRKPSIRNLQVLKKLVLQDRDTLTQEMIADIAKLPSLEELEFQWNPQLSVDAIKSHLGHLKRISIGNCCKTQFQSSIGELFMDMPMVHCGCKAYKDEVGFFRDDYSETHTTV